MSRARAAAMLMVGLPSMMSCSDPNTPTKRFSDPTWNQAIEQIYDSGKAHSQISDAVDRWIVKSAERDVKSNRYPVRMYFPDRDCVQLRLKVPAVGGEPVYCYRSNSVELIQEFSDVE